MKFTSRWLAVLAAIIGVTAIAAPAHAQATRTWVSGVGDDANPCSRTANGTGLRVVGGASLLSYGNKEPDGNGTNGAFIGAVIPAR